MSKFWCGFEKAALNAGGVASVMGAFGGGSDSKPPAPPPPPPADVSPDTGSLGGNISAAIKRVGG